MSTTTATQTTQEVISGSKKRNETMKALEWMAEGCVRLAERRRPTITQSSDIILKVTTTTICGSDLHMVHRSEIGMEKHDVMGHEFIGIIDEIGPDVKKFKVGDRVVVSAVIACGTCSFCKDENYSCCDTTNPSPMMDKAYGQRISGIFGYTHQTGGFDGGQAEYVRVPIGDFNCLRLPDDLPDEKAVLLSDIVCTSWFGNELADVKPGNTVAVWGCGPVGLLALGWAKYRGAKQIIAIDKYPYRLEIAKKLGAVVINPDKEDVLQTIFNLEPSGVHSCIDCTGYHPERENLPKDPNKPSETPQALNQAMDVARKCGSIAVIGDYFGYINNFHLGALAIKALNMRSGQIPVHRYWNKLMKILQDQKFDPTYVITHHFPFEKAEEAYQIFDKRADSAVKIILHTKAHEETQSGKKER
jgi:threonine dehydrogenase-like Zn-dependent dehydrogenase